MSSFLAEDTYTIPIIVLLCASGIPIYLEYLRKHDLIIPHLKPSLLFLILNRIPSLLFLLSLRLLPAFPAMPRFLALLLLQALWSRTLLRLLDGTSALIIQVGSMSVIGEQHN